MNRVRFIQTAMASVSMLTLPGLATARFKSNELISLEEIKEFVFAAHADFDKTRKMLNQNPLLLNCANQAKKGDFETALGGASHMGRRDIADLLVEQGARMDLFNLTFLGFTDFVKTMISQYPHFLKAPGPHGFTLLHHAQAGNNTALADWLKSQGLEELRFMDAF